MERVDEEWRTVETGCRRDQGSSRAVAQKKKRRRHAGKMYAEF
jgi:hypothetical protein